MSADWLTDWLTDCYLAPLCAEWYVYMCVFCYYMGILGIKVRLQISHIAKWFFLSVFFLLTVFISISLISFFYLISSRQIFVIRSRMNFSFDKLTLWLACCSYAWPVLLFSRVAIWIARASALFRAIANWFYLALRSIPLFYKFIALIKRIGVPFFTPSSNWKPNTQTKCVHMGALAGQFEIQNIKWPAGISRRRWLSLNIFDTFITLTKQQLTPAELIELEQ